MTEEERFYSAAENRAVEPRVEFPTVTTDEGEEPSNVQTITLTPEAFKELEAQVNDPSLRSAVVSINKLIPSAGEAAAGKAPAKGKGAPGEESKPVNGEASLDLIPFMYPGETSTTQRIFI